jgi:pimeloyl-ACP methyl ester carboxylesterase
MRPTHTRQLSSKFRRKRRSERLFTRLWRALAHPFAIFEKYSNPCASQGKAAPFGARWGAACLLLLLSGCAGFRRLNKDLDEVAKKPSVSGSIFGGVWSGKPIKVYLLHLPEGELVPHVLAMQVLKGPGDYRFRVLGKGRYLVAAIEDLNDNGRLDEGEPVAAVNDFDFLSLSEGQQLVDMNMRLSKELPARLRHMIREPLKLEAMVKHGEVLALTDKKFGPDSGPLGMWQPLTFVERYGTGLYMLQEFEKGKIPVLFVHGMSGYPQEFATLIEGLDRSRFQPWVVHYPSGARLDAIVRSILLALELTTLDRQPDQPLHDIFVVGHSMGGLVAHQLVRDHAAVERPLRISCLVTIDAPLGGTAGADDGVKHAPSVVPSWRDSGQESEFIANLFKRPLPPDLPYYLYFGYGGSSLLGGSATDGTVEVSSQLRPEGQDEATNVYGFDSGHNDVLSSPLVSARLNLNLKACADKINKAADSSPPRVPQN